MRRERLPVRRLAVIVSAPGVTGVEGAGDGSLPEIPLDGADAEAWARGWAVRRKQAKTERNYAEADRIRALLKAAGWEVRDNKDGSVEVVRARRAS